MGLFSKKEELSLVEKLSNVKGIFTKAHAEATELHKEIEEELQFHQSVLDEAKKHIDDTKKVRDETRAFISNLEKLI